MLVKQGILSLQKFMVDKLMIKETDSVCEI